ncbi:MAG TPA: xanthine dehydrogenase family protein subunit M [Candidatus Binatia bacterium]|jgi:carbon-monoxide dehydrogenase medium subunit
MLRRFRLEEPETIPEASALLARHGESARIYAGGTELLLVMKEGLARYERLVNVKKIPGLDQIKLDNGSISIGALATHRRLTRDALLEKHLPALAALEKNVANIRVREVGTIGGNLCFAEPHADPGTLFLALGASVIAAKADKRREIPIEKFFVDAYENALADDELLAEIRIPRLPARSAAAYLKFGYLERPSVGVAVFLALDGNAVREARVAVGCAGPTPRRVSAAEELLRGKSLDEASRRLDEAGAVAGRASDAISDLHGSKDYKEHIVGVLLKRAFTQAAEQCR